MTQGAVAESAINLKFSHMGVAVRDIDLMERFYVDVLGFLVTDRGDFGKVKVVFMSRNPAEHHEIVLATGRPAKLPVNEVEPALGPSIIQISFKLDSLADLRTIKSRLEAYGAKRVYSTNHGLAWSVYGDDPEGNCLEFFVDTDWYMPQPLIHPLDLEKPDEEIIEETLALCQTSPDFKPYGEWRSAVARVLAAPDGL